MNEIDEVKEYIGKAYNRYLDYARYQCSQVGIPDEAEDLLGEVLLNILQKEEELLKGLYAKKNSKNEFNQLDNFVLSVIKVNVMSDTATYRHRFLNKNYKKDQNVEMNRLNLIDELDGQPDGNELNKIRIVRFIFDRLALTDDERNAFNVRFFDQEKLSSLPHQEAKKAYKNYNIVSTAIREIAKTCGLFVDNDRLNMSKNIYRQKRVNELVYIFLSSHWTGNMSESQTLKYILNEKDYGWTI